MSEHFNACFDIYEHNEIIGYLNGLHEEMSGEVTEDNSFDHEFGTETRVDKYAVIYEVKLNDHPIALTKAQVKEREDFIQEHLL